MRRISAFFFPVRNAGKDERARAELAIITSIGAIIISIPGGLGFVAAGMPGRAAGTGLAIACSVLTLMALRLSRSVLLARAIFGISFTLLVVGNSLLSGDPSLLGWVALVSVIVVLLSDIKRALPWFAANGVVMLALTAFFLSDPTRVQMPGPGVLMVRLVFFLGMILGLMLFAAAGRDRALRALELARDEANRANALKSEFLANFSHEIRTPLNGVLGTTDGLLAGELTDEVRAQLLIIQSSGSSLLRTINDVLELSRIEAGRLDLFPVPTDVPALLSEVVELFRARATAGGLSLRLELESGHPRHVKVDDLRLRQVVQNLVGNAVKFTRTGEVVVRLARGEVSGAGVLTRISVQDTGPGIEAEAVSRLFSAFSQARPRTDRAGGSGLGLAICHQFIELMEGKLSVDSTPGKGSTFHVELTLPPSAQEQPVAAPPRQELAPPQRLKLLVVDDNEINLKVAVSLLRRLGHELVVARDGEQALEAIAEHQPDVVFMDRHMPVLDGLEATMRLRASGDGRPVVAVTASVYAEDRQRCLASGMNYFVSKPLTLQALQTALREVAGGSAPSKAGPARRILVVDDDPHVRLMTVRLLRSEGFEVMDAGDVEAAQILFELAEPGYVLVDQVLGGAEDGLHFAERLSRRCRALQVVVTSGRTPSEEQLGLLHGVGGRFLCKPYNRAGLMASLNHDDLLPLPRGGETPPAHADHEQ